MMAQKLSQFLRKYNPSQGMLAGEGNVFLISILLILQLAEYWC